jgi:hypothetical protein
LRARALLLAGFGAVAIGAALAVGCAALLGVDDVGYGALDGAPADGTAADGGLPDGAPPDGAPPDGDAGPPDACTPTGGLLFASFDQGSVTTGYVGGNLTAAFTEFSLIGTLAIDADASISPPNALLARGGNVFVYRALPREWLDGGLALEGDFRVETDLDAGTTQAQMMALYFVPPDGGISDKGSNASLSSEVMPTYVQLRLLVAGGDAGDVRVDVARTSLGAWVHARLVVTSAGAGDFDVTLDVDGQRTPDPVRLIGNASSFIGWGVNRRDFGDWRVRIDNACAHH